MSKKKNKAAKIKARRNKHKSGNVVINYEPHIQKALEDTRRYGDVKDIAIWWYYQNNPLLVMHNNISVKYCPEGVVLTHVSEYPDDYGYMVEARPDIIEWNSC